MSIDEFFAVEQQLQEKGPVEEEVQQLEPLVAEIADAVSAVVSGLSWSRVLGEMQLLCEARPSDPTCAWARKLRSVSFSGPIPDTSWPEALARVQQIANRVGAFELVVRVDEPGQRDEPLVAPDKAQFGLGSRKAAAIFVQTGCHLNASDDIFPGA